MLQDFMLDTALGSMAGLRGGAESGARVLALHGWLDNAASFIPLAGHLDGIELVALDLPGHGASAHLPSAADYLATSAARAAFAAADALGWERFALLGHSLGGSVASLMAAAQPQRIERLVSIESLGLLVETEDRTSARLREAFAAQTGLADKQLRVFADIDTAVRARMQGIGKVSEAAARLLVERGIVRVDGGYTWRSDPRLTLPTLVRMTEAQVRDLLRGIECPTRVIYGAPAQSYFPEPLRSERAALLPCGDLIVLPGSHHLHMEDAPAVAGAIGDFFLRG